MHRFLFAALLLSVALSAQELKIGESITVDRLMIDARVTNDAGEPMKGLGADEFRVLIDGKPATVESAAWVPYAGAHRASPLDEALEAEGAGSAAEGDATAASGRVFVFFFQTDFGRASKRVRGEMDVVTSMEDYLAVLEPADRVAVFSFDSHLKFRLDLSSDPKEIRKAISAVLRIDDPPRPAAVPDPALAPMLDPKELNDAATPERALLILAHALRPIPGPKTLLLFSWGMGEMVNGQLTLSRDFGAAAEALSAAETTVFSLNFGLGQLDAGSARMAHATGGRSGRTDELHKIAINRVRHALDGYYELEIRNPPSSSPGRSHVVNVKVTRRGAVVSARTSYEEQ